MGNCCSNDDDRPDFGLQQNVCVNYGPLKRDEEQETQNQPNTLAFGQPIKLIDEQLEPNLQQEFIHDGSQFLSQSRISQREPLERSFRAVITSPDRLDRTNRLRVVNQVESNNYLNEPLSDTQKDTRCMELNKNLKTPSLSNSIYRGANTAITQERPFFNAATNQNQGSIYAQNSKLTQNSYVSYQQQASNISRYSQAGPVAPINHSTNPIIKSLNFN